MRAEDAFEICLERYRGLRAVLRGRISAVRLGIPAAAGYQWRPERARAAEYIADFELAGQRALDRASWKGRWRLFVIYFLRGVEYRRAIALVGVPSGTFDWWTQQVKRTVGRELERTGLFPPGRYFREQLRGAADYRKDTRHTDRADETQRKEKGKENSYRAEAEERRAEQ